MNARRINFDRIARVALLYSDTIVARWIPGGRREGGEWVARNPRRSDRKPGSFKINLRNGRWGDFSTGDTGGDLISLAAYLHDLDQSTAALRVADMLGINPHE